MKNNLHEVIIVNSYGHEREKCQLRINDPIRPGQRITAFRNKLSLPKLSLEVVSVVQNWVYCKKV